MMKTTGSTSAKEAGPSFCYTASDFLHAAEPLRRGELVAIPTETVYGLAADACNESACRRIFRVKGRPLLDPLIVHIGRWDQLDTIAFRCDAAEQLAKTFWPGPLTLILDKKPTVPDIVTAGKPTVAVRIPDHSMTRALLDMSNLAVAAPSANPFGYLSPTTVQHVRDQLGDKVRYMVDGGPCRIGLESTIVDVRDREKPLLYRPGGVPTEQIEEVLQRKLLHPQKQLQATETLTAPGTLSSHYSPHTKLILLPFGCTTLTNKPGRKAVVRCHRETIQPEDALTHEVFWLAEEDDKEEMAHNLFALMHHLDAVGFDCIDWELPDSEKGMARAIKDRLQRAAHKFL